MARKFLLIVGGLILAFVLAALAFKKFVNPLSPFFLEPDHGFATEERAPAPDYTKDESWVILPGKPGQLTNLPKGHVPSPAVTGVDVFFIHPTTFVRNTAWNAAIDDKTATVILDNQVVLNQVTALAGTGSVFAPRYRQATLWSFFPGAGDNGVKAQDFAYADVLKAFDQYVEQRSSGRPFILAGHSQGSRHLLRLLRDRIAGKPLATRMVAAYVTGWTVSETHDLAQLPGIKPCTRPEATGCLMSWVSFTEGSDASGFRAVTALDGKPLFGESIVCTNPIKGVHKGLIPWAAGVTAAEPVQSARLTAHCDQDGILRIAPIPEAKLGYHEMTPGNYHIVDYNLFWADIDADVRARAAAYKAAHP